MNSRTLDAVVATPPIGRVAGRFLWKELRAMWPLAAGLIVLAAMEMLFSRVVVPSDAVSDWMLTSALGATALFAVAGPVVLFAAERHERTTKFLATLPPAGGATFIGKLAALAAMIAIVLAATLLAGQMIGGIEWSASGNAGALWGQGAVVISEAVAWGILASLLVSQPLLAATLGATLAALNSQVAMWLTVPNAKGFTVGDFQQATPGRLALVALIAAVDFWLGTHWLQRTELPQQRRLGFGAGRKSQAGGEQTVAASTILPRSRTSQSLAILGRYLWQSWRESWKTVVATIAGGLLLMAAVEISLWSGFVAHNNWQNGFFPVSLFFVPALLGAQTFNVDQRDRRYRFIAEHNGGPRLLWLGRQWFWWTPTALWCAVVCLIAWTLGAQLWGDWTANRQFRSEFLIGMGLRVSVLFCIGSFAAHAVGQLASLLFRSAILAWFCALGGSVVVLAWCYIVLAGLLSPIWFVAPLAAGALVASWIRCRDWLTDRNTWARWAGVIAAVGLPLVGTLSAVVPARQAQVAPTYVLTDRTGPRTTQVGLADDIRASVVAAPNKFARLQEKGRRLADEYRTLASLKDAEPLADLAAQLDELSRVVAVLPDAAAYRDSPNRLPIEQLELWAWEAASNKLAENPEESLSLAMSARRMSVQKAWTAANASYARGVDPRLWKWARLSKQTAETLAEAVDQLGAIERIYPSPVEAILLQYVDALKVARGEEPPQFLTGGRSPGAIQWLSWVAFQLPGEQQRSIRALEILATPAYRYGLDVLILAARVQSVPTAAAIVDTERLRSRLHDLPNFTFAALQLFHRPSTSTPQRNARLLWYAKTSYLASAEFNPEFVAWNASRRWVYARSVGRLERIRLALRAYQLAEGALPKKLTDLTPDFLTDADLVDLYTGQPYEWRRGGLDLPIPRDGNPAGIPIDAKSPLLWSPGLLLMQPIKMFAGSAAAPGGNAAYGGWTGAAKHGEDERSSLPQVYRFTPTGAFRFSRYNYAYGSIVLEVAE